MPTHAQVNALVSLVERGHILEAIDACYAADVVMQDNLDPPTAGRIANRERLAGNVAGIREVHTHRAQRILVDGDSAVIHWLFEFSLVDGTRLRFDQLALQTWRGADDDARIVHERFIFDTATIAVASDTR